MAIKKSNEVTLITATEWDEMVDTVQNTTSGHDHDGVNSKLISGINPTIENYTGSDCTGTDGTTGRVLTLSNTNTSSKELVFLDRNVLMSGDYTVNHLSSNSTITFNVRVWNDQKIKVFYFV